MNAPDCICSPGRLPLGAFCAGRDDLEREALHDDRISIRAPRAGCDFLRLQDIARALISIHAPRVGRDCIPLNPAEQPENFNPRAPCGARPLQVNTDDAYVIFQSTRPVWGATLTRLTAGWAKHDFNPRAPCGARLIRRRYGRLMLLFQSTRPVWGATSGWTISTATIRFQSTRPVWGATSASRLLVPPCGDFNPRAPCGARRRARLKNRLRHLFQSTRPVWGATMLQATIHTR